MAFALGIAQNVVFSDHLFEIPFDNFFSQFQVFQCFFKAIVNKRQQNGYKQHILHYFNSPISYFQKLTICVGVIYILP